MKTPDGISAEDWDVVHEFALEMLDASVNGSEDDRQECRTRFLNYLGWLEGKYGERASILATRADYIDDVQRKRELLTRAYVLADASNDGLNKMEIAHSLAELHIDELKDVVEGSRWLERLKQHAAQQDDASRQRDYERLREEIEKLPRS